MSHAFQDTTYKDFLVLTLTCVRDDVTFNDCVELDYVSNCQLDHVYFGVSCSG